MIKRMITGAKICLATLTAMLAVLVVVTPATADSQAAPNRAALAFSFPEGNKTHIGMAGTFLIPQANGLAEIDRRDGRSKIKLTMNNLTYPKDLGNFHTIYVLWAIGEGHSERLAEIPMKDKFVIEASTSQQTYALLITAEPHAEVKRPSPVILAENTQNRKTSGAATMHRLKYRGDDGFLYLAPLPNAADINDKAPLSILGARRAVEIARRAQGERPAEPELQQAESKLAELERVWPQFPQSENAYMELARDVMQTAERARSLALERALQNGES